MICQANFTRCKIGPLVWNVALHPKKLPQLSVPQQDIGDVPKVIKQLKKQMLAAAKNLQFEKAAKLRDEIKRLEVFLLSVR